MTDDMNWRGFVALVKAYTSPQRVVWNVLVLLLFIGALVLLWGYCF